MDKSYSNKIELSPNEWLFWKDEEFNLWRRKYDFPRIVEFLFNSMPFFSLWLSEQDGLTENDLLYHGPSRFIKTYGESVTYIEYDASISLFEVTNSRKVIKYKFLDEHAGESIPHHKVIRKFKYVSYLDWVSCRKRWAFPNSIKDLRGVVECFTPSGVTSKTSDCLNSDSNIAFNIPLYMSNVPVELCKSKQSLRSPPKLELLKLGGGESKIVDGMIGEKNLEFTNLDNLTLISPIITSYQYIAFSTLRNFKVVGVIHAAKFHQCTIDILIEKGSLDSCQFEYCKQKIELQSSKLNKVKIKSRQLGLKLSDTEVSGCQFLYSNRKRFSSKERKKFHNSAKMIFSHLGYSDLAGDHFLIEKKSERKHQLELFLDIKSNGGVKGRLKALWVFLYMALIELYWGYGEKPFNIIVFSMVLISGLALLGYFVQGSSTYSDITQSVLFAFQSYTNVSISEITQKSDLLNNIGAVMSFCGLMSVGLLVASLSSKSKDYN